MSDLLDRITTLLGASTRDLDEIEHTLTDGYAQALSLEAERWRLERRVTGLSRGIEHGDTLTRLRGALNDLRRHADDVRIGSPAA
jgi:hypothetical protein